MRGLSSRRVILTGGASGIGRAAALRLAQEGCVLGIFDLDEAGAEATAAECKGAQAYRVDITDRAQIEAAVAAFGPVEGLANVAGWDTPVDFLATDRALWDKVVQINLYGPLNMHHVVVRGMAERGFGRVVNVASDLIYRDRKGEIYLMQRNPKQRWYYVPETRADEVLLLKCFDSTRDVRSVLSPRGAFEDPTVPADVLPRESIELRTIALHAA